jgi:deoxycytidylate deaminase
MLTVCHAAIHAILNKNAENLRGCTLYTTLFPSHEDAKMIIQAGIRKVVYLSDDYYGRAFTKIARKLFDTADPRVECTGYVVAIILKGTVSVFSWARKRKRPYTRSAYYVIYIAHKVQTLFTL